MEITNVLSEAGSALTAGLLEARLIDRVIIFLAGKLVGGVQAPGAIGGRGIDKMADAVLLEDIELRKSGEDVLVHAAVRYPETKRD